MNWKEHGKRAAATALLAGMLCTMTACNMNPPDTKLNQNQNAVTSAAASEAASSTGEESTTDTSSELALRSIPKVKNPLSSASDENGLPTVLQEHAKQLAALKQSDRTVLASVPSGDFRIFYDNTRSTYGFAAGSTSFVAMIEGLTNAAGAMQGLNQNGLRSTEYYWMANNGSSVLTWTQDDGRLGWIKNENAYTGTPSSGKADTSVSGTLSNRGPMARLQDVETVFAPGDVTVICSDLLEQNLKLDEFGTYLAEKCLNIDDNSTIFIYAIPLEFSGKLDFFAYSNGTDNQDYQIKNFEGERYFFVIVGGQSKLVEIYTRKVENEWNQDGISYQSAVFSHELNPLPDALSFSPLDTTLDNKSLKDLTSGVENVLGTNNLVTDSAGSLGVQMLRENAFSGLYNYKSSAMNYLVQAAFAADLPEGVDAEDAAKLYEAVSVSVLQEQNGQWVDVDANTLTAFQVDQIIPSTDGLYENSLSRTELVSPKRSVAYLRLRADTEGLPENERYLVSVELQVRKYIRQETQAETLKSLNAKNANYLEAWEILSQNAASQNTADFAELSEAEQQAVREKLFGVIDLAEIINPLNNAVKNYAAENQTYQSQYLDCIISTRSTRK